MGNHLSFIGIATYLTYMTLTFGYCSLIGESSFILRNYYEFDIYDETFVELTILNSHL